MATILSRGDELTHEEWAWHCGNVHYMAVINNTLLYLIDQIVIVGCQYSNTGDDSYHKLELLTDFTFDITYYLIINILVYVYKRAVRRCAKCNGFLSRAVSMSQKSILGSSLDNNDSSTHTFHMRGVSISRIVVLWLGYGERLVTNMFIGVYIKSGETAHSVRFGRYDGLWWVRKSIMLKLRQQPQYRHPGRKYNLFASIKNIVFDRQEQVIFMYQWGSVPVYKLVSSKHGVPFIDVQPDIRRLTQPQNLNTTYYAWQKRERFMFVVFCCGWVSTQIHSGLLNTYCVITQLCQWRYSKGQW